jgi:microsomal prostaglandin-E synthase 2
MLLFATTAYQHAKAEPAVSGASTVVQGATGGAASAASVPFSEWKLQLYQYETCPFCNKVRAFLDFYRVPYEVVEVDPLSKSQLKSWTAYRKVPDVRLNGKEIQGSGDIINQLHAALPAETRARAGPTTANTEKWCKWVDDHLIHIFPPNIYETLGQSFASFDYMKESFPWYTRGMSQAVGAPVMYLVARRNKKKYNISENPRISLYNAANQFVGGMNGKTFMGGDQPDLADISVFGALRSLMPFAAGKDLMSTQPAVAQWYNRMATFVGPDARIKAAKSK